MLHSLACPLIRAFCASNVNVDVTFVFFIPYMTYFTLEFEGQLIEI